jgi:hypothetical protein
MLAGSPPAVAFIAPDDDDGDAAPGGERPHIPEPIVFDMVPPLGVSRGELKINSPALQGCTAPIPAGHDSAAAAAPGRSARAPTTGAPR